MRSLIGSGGNLGDDGDRILGARVVRRDVGAVGGRGGTTHERPLLAIAVSPGPDHDEHTNCAEVTSLLDDLGDRVGRVGIVDDDRERSGPRYQFETARHCGQCVQTGPDRLEVDARFECARCRNQCIGDIEPPRQGHGDRNGRTAGRDVESTRRRVDADVAPAHVATLAEADGA